MSFDYVMKMPIVLRKYFIGIIRKIHEEEQKAIEKQSSNNQKKLAFPNNILNAGLK